MTAAGYFHWRARTPQPATSTHRIAAGGYARALVTGNRASGTRGSHRPPHHLQFASSAGAVDVYVVPCTIGYRKEEWDYINNLTEEFAADRVPAGVAARASGDRGRIDLRGLGRREGRASYVVLMRSAYASEVTLVVHYGPS
jgi:hypothetical protein